MIDEALQKYVGQSIEKIFFASMKIDGGGPYSITIQTEKGMTMHFVCMSLQIDTHGGKGFIRKTMVDPVGL
jgi:hypothetical protein